MLDVGPQTTTHQNGTDDGLKESWWNLNTRKLKAHIKASKASSVLVVTPTLICQELSHLTSLKFLPRLLLVQKQTLRILVGPPSPVKRDSGLGSGSLSFGQGTFQVIVSPNITSYMMEVCSLTSYPQHPVKKHRA